MRPIVSDLENLPPLKYDEIGRPQLPNPISESRRRTLSEPERKVRFLLAYNVFGANEGMACREAGVDRKTYKSWLKADAKFKEVWTEVRDEIADRLQAIYNEVIGLTPATMVRAPAPPQEPGQPPGKLGAPRWAYKDVNQYVLLASLKSLKPQLFDGDTSTGGGFTLKLGVPRPQGRGLTQGRADDTVQPDGKANPLPHEPG